MVVILKEGPVWGRGDFKFLVLFPPPTLPKLSLFQSLWDQSASRRQLLYFRRL